VDVEPFEDWYQREHPRLVATLTVVAGDVGVAAEVTDEAFVRAFERWPRVGAMASPTGWTFTTALHLVRRRYRRHALEARIAPRLARARTSVPPDWSTEVWDAIRRLPVRERQALALFHVADLTTDEVAQVMGIQPGTVGSTLHHARRRLAAALAGDATGAESDTSRCDEEDVDA
jgi:RNA polymerase sigma-70 factor, ECF subfamily